MLVILALLVVIAILCIMLYKQDKGFKQERKDLINRILSKSTSDYRELTKVGNLKDSEEAPKKHVNPLDEQLQQMGALKPGAMNTYRGM